MYKLSPAPFLLIFWLLPMGARLGAADGCVTCHAKLTAEHPPLQHNYADWKKSVHAKAGIGCQACHGGNPDTADPVQAHQGVLSSRDKNSPVYFQKIPGTCGRCHAEELQAFKKSIHYKMLERSGKGPNCLTCHGAMATAVLSYSDLENTCSLCHGKPTQAAQALSLLRSMKKLLDVHAKKLPADFQERYRKIRGEWHSFNVIRVVQGGEQWIKEAKAALKKK